MTEISRERLTRDSRRICIQSEQWANNFLASRELTASQAHILLYILRHSREGTSLTDIHREFGYSMAALSCMLKRLRTKGYIRSEPCAADDRCKLLFGTEKGKAAQEALDQAVCTAQSRLYRCFSPEELNTLDRLHRKMLQNLSLLTSDTQTEGSNP